jgi:hypothetical protein
MCIEQATVERSGVQFPAEAQRLFTFPKLSDRLCASPSIKLNGSQALLPRGLGDLCGNLPSHLHLVPRLQMSEAVSQCPM